MKSLMLATLAIAALGAAGRVSAADLNVGDQAPNFTLQGTDGKTYQLSEFKGKQAVVLAWYPAAFTQGCTIECKSLAENGHLIKKYDAIYFMASTDAIEGEKGNKAFAEAYKADFPLLSDPSKEAAAAYGVLNEKSGRANRWTFYIDQNGKIAYIDKEVSKRLQTSAQDMAAKLAELKVPEKHR